MTRHRMSWPSFLSDPARTGRLEDRGLLTRPAARSRRAARTASDVRTGRVAVDSLQVLVVRLGFAANRSPELTSMDASGDFRLAADSTIIVDPPPHDANYFDALLLGLHAYWSAQSYGRASVGGTVFPPQGEPSIKLSDVADYGPGAGGFWTLELLERYFRDNHTHSPTPIPTRIGQWAE